MGKGIVTFVDNKIEIRNSTTMKIQFFREMSILTTYWYLAKFLLVRKIINTLLVTLLDYKIKALHIMFPETTIYIKCYDRETKWMHFLIEYDELLNKILV